MEPSYASIEEPSEQALERKEKECPYQLLLPHSVSARMCLSGCVCYCQFITECTIVRYYKNKLQKAFLMQGFEIRSEQENEPKVSIRSQIFNCLIQGEEKECCE